MSNKAINWAYEQSGIKAGPKFTLVTLADMADHQHSCYPGIDSLADLTGYGATAIRGHLDTLVAAGLIITMRRHKRNGARTSDRYYLQLGDAKTVTADSDATSKGPNAGKRADLTPEIVAPNAGFRGAYKEEPKEEPKGEPTDKPLEGLDGVLAEVVGIGFDTFWKIYPRHEAKKPAEAKFRKACEHTDSHVIIAGARRYAEFVKAVRRSPEHILHPTTWLNQERWTDELTVPADVPSGSGKPTARQAAAAVHEELLRRQAAEQNQEISA